jgi:hypothetical protein
LIASARWTFARSLAVIAALATTIGYLAAALVSPKTGWVGSFLILVPIVAITVAGFVIAGSNDFVNVEEIIPSRIFEVAEVASSISHLPLPPIVPVRQLHSANIFSSSGRPVFIWGFKLCINLDIEERYSAKELESWFVFCIIKGAESTGMRLVLQNALLFLVVASSSFAASLDLWTIPFAYSLAFGLSLIQRSKWRAALLDAALRSAELTCEPDDARQCVVSLVGRLTEAERRRLFPLER